MSLVSHSAKSELLEEIIIELRKKGIEIPANVMADLKSARTLMKIENTDHRGRGETEPKIDEYLGSVEAYAITEAGKLFANEQVEKWLKALDLAGCESCVTVEETNEESRFVHGVPSDKKWIRVEPIASLPLEKLKQMASETNLSFQLDKDGHLVVFGEDKDVKIYVKKISQKV